METGSTHPYLVLRSFVGIQEGHQLPGGYWSMCVAMTCVTLGLKHFNVEAFERGCELSVISLPLLC